MKLQKFNRSCISPSAFALLLYLLISSENEIKNTYYFFEYAVSETIRKKFTNYYYYDSLKYLYVRKGNKYRYGHVKFVFLILTVRLGHLIRWPFLRKAKIFAMDYTFFAQSLIGNKKYVQLEDAPNSYKIIMENKLWMSKIDNFWKERVLKRKILSLIFGEAYGHEMGNNELCSEIVMTSDECFPSIKKEKIRMVSISDLWRNSSDSKKNLILSIYDILDEDIKLIKSKKYILLTQAFSRDGIITEEEQGVIYSKIIANYDSHSILIKTHPRDIFDYKQIFPNVSIFEKNVPFQLFDLLGVQFEKVITVNSTAATLFTYQLDIDWYGSEISESIIKALGNIECPLPHKKMPINI
jgi:hypothetical protein